MIRPEFGLIITPVVPQLEIAVHCIPPIGRLIIDESRQSVVPSSLALSPHALARRTSIASYKIGYFCPFLSARRPAVGFPSKDILNKKLYRGSLILAVESKIIRGTSVAPDA